METASKVTGVSYVTDDTGQIWLCWSNGNMEPVDCDTLTVEAILTIIN